MSIAHVSEWITENDMEDHNETISNVSVSVLSCDFILWFLHFTSTLSLTYVQVYTHMFLDCSSKTKWSERRSIWIAIIYQLLARYFIFCFFFFITMHMCESYIVTFDLQLSRSRSLSFSYNTYFISIGIESSTTSSGMYYIWSIVHSYRKTHTSYFQIYHHQNCVNGTLLE